MIPYIVLAVLAGLMVHVYRTACRYVQTRRDRPLPPHSLRGGRPWTGR